MFDPTRRSILRLFFTLALTAGLAACFSEEPELMDPDGNGEPAAVVEMTSQLTFSPRNVTIRVGERVRWRNVSNVVHTATADPSLANDRSHVRLPAGAETFNSGDVPAGGQYTRTFTVPGRYDYFCIPHEAAGMLGSITVTQ